MGGDCIITEIVGVAGSVVVLVSMLYKTHTYHGAMMLRVTNLVGSLIFIAYGIMLPAYSTIALNIITTFVNLYYIIRLKNDYQDSFDDPWEDK